MYGVFKVKNTDTVQIGPVINNLRRHLNELSTNEGTGIRKKNGKRICH